MGKEKDEGDEEGEERDEEGGDEKMEMRGGGKMSRGSRLGKERGKHKM